MMISMLPQNIIEGPINRYLFTNRFRSYKYNFLSDYIKDVDPYSINLTSRPNEEIKKDDELFVNCHHDGIRHHYFDNNWIMLFDKEENNKVIFFAFNELNQFLKIEMLIKEYQRYRNEKFVIEVSIETNNAGKSVVDINFNHIYVSKNSNIIKEKECFINNIVEKLIELDAFDRLTVSLHGMRFDLTLNDTYDRIHHHHHHVTMSTKIDRILSKMIKMYEECYNVEYDKKYYTNDHHFITVKNYW